MRTAVVLPHRYVPGREELVALMADEVSQPGAPADPAAGWRERITEAARGERALYRRHPWMLYVAQGRPLLGPNSMDATEVALRNVEGLGLTPKAMISVVVLVSSFVAARVADRHPLLGAAGEVGAWEAEATVETFEFGLERVLDGIAALIESRR